MEYKNSIYGKELKTLFLVYNKLNSEAIDTSINIFDLMEE